MLSAWVGISAPSFFIQRETGTFLLVLPVLRPSDGGWRRLWAGEVPAGGLASPPEVTCPAQQPN